MFASQLKTKRVLIWTLSMLLLPPLFVSSFAASATQMWAVRYDEYELELRGSGEQVLVDGLDNVYMIGEYADQLLIAKYNPAGQLLWDHRISNRQVYPPRWRPSRAAAVDSSNRLVIASQNGFILKLDELGGVLWEANVSVDLGKSAQLFAAAVDLSGNIYAAGTIDDGTAGLDALLVKYAPGGVLLWQATTDNAAGQDQITVLRIGSDQSVYCGGAFNLPGEPAYYHGGLLILRYTAQGGLLFQISESNLGGASDIDVDEAGNVYAAGWVLGNPWGSGTIHVDKYDGSGNLLWRNLEQPYRSVQAVNVDREGNLYVAGYANTTRTFFRYMVRKYDPNGGLLWDRQYSAYGDNEIYAMVLDEGTEPIVTGEFGYCPGYIRTIKLSPAGEIRWAFSYTPAHYFCGSVNYGFSIAMDSKRSVYVTGYTYDPTKGGRYPYKPTLIKYAQPMDVDIDIKPGSFPNALNLKSGGFVATAILSGPDFDAAQVDPLTVTLAQAPVVVQANGKILASTEDVNGDGVLDLVVHVRASELQLTAADTEAVLEGQTFDAQPIEGSDSVVIVP